MVEIAIPFNRRTVQFAQRRQHLVNHGLQRDVNHSRQTPHRYFRLTQNIKRIPTRFCHDFRVTRHKAGRGRVSRRQCEVADAPGRAVLYGSTLPACLCGSLPATRLEVELHGERVAKTCASAGTATAPRNSKAVIVIRMPEDSHHRRQKTKGDGCECLTRRIAVNAYSAP
ncbi:MAG TPA: hypothetical protein VE970_07135 [Pseudolabrys sp.]|nr:hypothetical protein [Pseudolabrys sp.]